MGDSGPSVDSDSCSWLTWEEPGMMSCCCQTNWMKLNASIGDAFLLDTVVKSDYLSITASFCVKSQMISDFWNNQNHHATDEVPEITQCTLGLGIIWFIVNMTPIFKNSIKYSTCTNKKLPSSSRLQVALLPHRSRVPQGRSWAQGPVCVEFLSRILHIHMGFLQILQFSLISPKLVDGVIMLNW